jgi:hypothetical protein
MMATMAMITAVTPSTSATTQTSIPMTKALMSATSAASKDSC